MTRYEVVRGYFRFLRESKLPSDEVILSAGAAMVVLGYRNTTTDLDVDVPEWFFLQHKHRGNHRVTTHGEFVAYNRKVSLQVNTLEPGDIIAVRTKLEGLIYTYSEWRLLEQKLVLMELPNRNPGKIHRDMADILRLMNALSKHQTKLDELGYTQRFLKAQERFEETLVCL